jgi:hypothetical protein
MTRQPELISAPTDAGIHVLDLSQAIEVMVRRMFRRTTA